MRVCDKADDPRCPNKNCPHRLPHTYFSESCLRTHNCYLTSGKPWSDGPFNKMKATCVKPRTLFDYIIEDTCTGGNAITT